MLKPCRLLTSPCKAVSANSGSASTSASSASAGKASELFAHVSQSLIDKTRRGEIIEFGSLLPPNPAEAGSDAKKLRVSEDSGELVVSAALPSRRKIEGFYSWLEAWTIYCEIIFAERPDKALEFIGYQARILQAARRYRWPAVLEYDTAFRQRAARNSEVRWDVVDIDLYSRCFTGQGHVTCTTCKRSGHSAATCTVREGRKAEGLAKSSICALYNSSKCSFRSCKFRHVCKTCGGDHPATQCTSGSK